MTRWLERYVLRFRKDESGNTTIEFVILFLPMFMIMVMAAELGIIHIHYSTLERAVDTTVRDLRLGTGTAPQHDQIRDSICARASFVDDCTNDIRIEMVIMDPFNWTTPPTDVDCIDASEPIQPVRTWQNGASNQLMFMRVCAKYDPILPHIGMADNMILDGAGQYSLVTTSAFVQEPQ